MTLLAVERIKLFSTRSPWWCFGVIFFFGLGIAALVAGFADADDPVTVATTQFGVVQFGQYVVLVLAALAVTTEYRFGTIRATFTAVPNRTAVLSAKATLVAGVCALVGLAAALSSWLLGVAIDTQFDLTIDTSQEYRSIFGVAPLYGLYAVIAIGVGLLVRQSAAAISLLLVWTLVIETIIASILHYSLDIPILDWMPFSVATNFITAGDYYASGQDDAVGYPFGPWGSLLYFAAIAFAVLFAGIAVANRRDA